MLTDTVITKATVELTGDGIPEVVALTGQRAQGEQAWRGLTLRVEDGATCRVASAALPQDIGYDPRLWLGDLTGAGSVDALVSVASGGSGGIGYYTAYAYAGGALAPIFLTDEYADMFRYEVAYQDGFLVRVRSLANATAYLVSVADRPADYLAALYDADGALKAPREGSVDPLSLLYPADIDGDGVYELVAYQRVTGLYNADALAAVVNALRWNGERFALWRQTVEVYGSPSEPTART